MGGHLLILDESWRLKSKKCFSRNRITLIGESIGELVHQLVRQILRRQ